MIKAGIIGATGYAGEQLVWILNKHPNASIEFYCSHNYTNVSFDNVYLNFYSFIEDKCIDINEAINRLKDIEVLFISLPSGNAFDIAEKALNLGINVIDLGADFRLDSKEVYEDWYVTKHKAASLIKNSIYGLTELNRDKIKECNLLANPGCYPTATILALAPLLKNDLVNLNSIIVDAKSGVSGAGRGANIANLFTECNESIKAYGAPTHRHTPEIEQELSKIAKKDLVISFTPHLVPMSRGILATCYANLNIDTNTEELLNLYREFYKDEYFIKILDTLPETRWVKGSNFCHIGIRVDKRTNRVMVLSSIDNLVKGAAGQAVQNMNIMFGLEETEGLEFISMVP
ncbi:MULTISPECIES: N-acetyl-gamma-glutamyl-phosphate reductase [Clostridium]|jgi:N-acetyl-gamma-glutamyl-phosphate reductase|uniref:N-acetyl-gamma-glutamyl-phosphate reductase n=2 Tax=Clostridium TaxID=1485 RepID=A0A151ALS3_9CLOT|nr:MULTISPECIES: N-acetyl-gamma-glutamyl-phosphate reductase [Clostridium]KYH28357.1 N-acetyl-gamma-glutamyl-phosphate reductase [Clostridium colicanis DSM 13634]MBE6043586.1 N-acetyl-gamma-glutamyl-phosphate reductase [Clostridium thermopalmarium]PRR68799.1 N-acetyl-gamma-glutamyl-phosphate reductase [Clostridium thermopalmarium DSM 5974]PVZ22618.1 N-acetyl-gamma-glutamyl-phosphate reductase [Clostridium thermopalmarium DSM 5974]